MPRPRSTSHIALVLLLTGAFLALGEESPPASPVALVIHGGAGNLEPESLDPETEALYRVALTAALTRGHQRLSEGAGSVDVVESVIRELEDEPLFNAGRGAVFTAEGRNELDASIMDGATTKAGAVAGVTRVRHPISAARAVMERTPHVLLAGPGADRFAAGNGLELVDPSFFRTERRWEALERVRRRESGGAGGGGGHFGTVGAVALDQAGRIAAGTSTGGMTNKRHGRVGDSPIIGAGTYANQRCGVSGTGHGEFFIRFAVAFDICARLRDPSQTIRSAAEAVVLGTLVEAGGDGGIIALDADGMPALVFNTTAMYRGWALADGEPQVAIFQDN